MIRYSLLLFASVFIGSSPCSGSLIVPKQGGSGEVLLTIDNSAEPTATIDEFFSGLYSFGLDTSVTPRSRHDTRSFAPVVPLLAEALGHPPTINPVNLTHEFRFDLADRTFQGIYDPAYTFGTTSIVGTEFHTPSAPNVQAMSVPEPSSFLLVAVIFVLGIGAHWIAIRRNS